MNQALQSKTDQALDRLVDHFIKKVGEGHKPSDTLDSIFNQMKDQYPTLLVAMVSKGETE